MDLPLNPAAIAARLAQYRDGNLPMADAVRDLEYLLEQARLAENCGRKVIELQAEVELLNETIEAYANSYNSTNGDFADLSIALDRLASRWESVAVGRKKYLREDDIADTLIACAAEVRRL